MCWQCWPSCMWQDGRDVALSRRWRWRWRRRWGVKYRNNGFASARKMLNEKFLTTCQAVGRREVGRRCGAGTGTWPAGLDVPQCWALEICFWPSLQHVCFKISFHLRNFEPRDVPSPLLEKLKGFVPNARIVAPASLFLPSPCWTMIWGKVCVAWKT